MNNKVQKETIILKIIDFMPSAHSDERIILAGLWDIRKIENLSTWNWMAFKQMNNNVSVVMRYCSATVLVSSSSLVCNHEFRSSSETATAAANQSSQAMSINLSFWTNKGDIERQKSSFSCTTEYCSNICGLCQWQDEKSDYVLSSINAMCLMQLFTYESCFIKMIILDDPWTSINWNHFGKSE